MKIIWITILASLICSVIYGQRKLILYNGDGREVIKEGKLIGITLKGESYAYKDWKKVYKCNHTIQKNLWVVDNIGNDSLYLSGYDYDVSIKHVSVLRKDINTLKDKEYIIDSIIPSRTRISRYDTLLCGIASLELKGQKYKAVNYKDIESLTFSHLSMKHLERSPSFGHLFSGSNLNINSSAAAFVFLVIISVEITFCITYFIVYDIEAQVHTYYLKDWKIKIKPHLSRSS